MIYPYIYAVLARERMFELDERSRRDQLLRAAREPREELYPPPRRWRWETGGTRTSGTELAGV